MDGRRDDADAVPGVIGGVPVREPRRQGVELYDVVVFVHVISAIVLVGSTLLAPFMGAAMRRATTSDGLLGPATILMHTGKFAGRAAPITLLSGLYLAFSGEWWGSGWLELSLVLFVLAGVGAIGVLDPAATRIVDAATAAPAGPIDAELDALRHDRRMASTEAFLLPGDVTIVFLMTTKPGFGGALAAVAVAAVAGAVLHRFESKPSDRMAPA
jgi:uncharacterized membrane protein